MSLTTDHSLETHGRSYATEESRASGRFLDRSRTAPSPVYAIAEGGVHWRCDQTGYFVANARSGQRRGGIIGRAAFSRIKMQKADKISREDVPFGQRPNGNWRRLVPNEFSTGQEVCYDHRIYGRCLLLATDGVHAIIETHETFEWRPNKYGQPTFTLVGEREHMEVDFGSLTQLPQENIPLVRKRTCRSCACEFTSLLDDCPDCNEPYRKAAKPRAKSKVREAVLDSIIAELLS
tara:strand:+ start:2150 stop:2854 length:705 start_codon:yes stop_codon:yes gene_type:complete